MGSGQFFLGKSPAEPSRRVSPPWLLLPDRSVESSDCATGGILLAIGTLGWAGGRMQCHTMREGIVRVRVRVRVRAGLCICRASSLMHK